MTSRTKIQEKWKNLFVLGLDCIVYASGRITIGEFYSMYDPNNGTKSYRWAPICDTTLENIEKYDDDIWTEVDIFKGGIKHQNQNIVFGDGGMGNEGYIASTALNGELNWSIFFTFSNPICKAEVIGETLICYNDAELKISIDPNELNKISIKYETELS